MSDKNDDATMCLRLSPGRRRVCEIDAPVWIFNLLHRAFDTEWMWNRLFIFLCLCWMWDCLSISISVVRDFFSYSGFPVCFSSLSLSLCFYLSLSFLVLPSSSLQYRVDKGSSVYFLCLCCLCFYLSLFHIHFCLQCTMQHEQWKV